MSMPSTASQVDTRDMIVVHDALRREYSLMPELVRGVVLGDSARVTVVADHVELISTLLHHHHTGEDQLLWPTLRPRLTPEDAAVVELMESQHHAIAEPQARVDAALTRWRAGGGAADRDELAESLELLAERLREHLAAEEQHLLPIAERHVSEAEWARLGEAGMAGVEKSQLPVVLGLMMYRADPEVITSMLSHAPRVVRLVMPRLAPRARLRYVRHVYGRTDF